MSSIATCLIQLHNPVRPRRLHLLHLRHVFGTGDPDFVLQRDPEFFD